MLLLLLGDFGAIGRRQLVLLDIFLTLARDHHLLLIVILPVFSTRLFSIFLQVIVDSFEGSLRRHHSGALLFLLP